MAAYYDATTDTLQDTDTHAHARDAHTERDRIDTDTDGWLDALDDQLRAVYGQHAPHAG